MHLINDVYLKPARGRTKFDVFPQGPYFVNSPVGCAVNLHYVQAAAPGYFSAGIAFLAGVYAGAIFAIQALGKNPRSGSLAYAPGTGKQISVRQAVFFDRILQEINDVALADELVEALRPPF